MDNFAVDTSDLDKFVELLGQAGSGDFENEVTIWLESIGVDFLNEVRNEIIRKHVVNTRLLLNSFEKGVNGHIWNKTNGGLTLEVGTNVKYARAVNDGHWTNSPGVSQRWVPGTWSGDKFTYQPGADTGMLLKQRFIQGRHFWESAGVIYKSMFHASLEAKMDEWLLSYFGG